jgi:hypothetical protein
MSFLQSHFQGRATVTHVDNSNMYGCGNDTDNENEKEHRKETAQQSAGSAVTETTDESTVRSQHKRSTKNLRKSVEPASAFIIIYILEKKEEQPKEENAVGIAVTLKSCLLYCQNIDEQKMFFNSF